VCHNKNIRSFQTQSGRGGIPIRKGYKVLILKVVQKYQSEKSRMMTAFGAILGIRSKVILHEAKHQTSYKTVGIEMQIVSK